MASDKLTVSPISNLSADLERIQNYFVCWEKVQKGPQSSNILLLFILELQEWDGKIIFENWYFDGLFFFLKFVRKLMIRNTKKSKRSLVDSALNKRGKFSFTWNKKQGICIKFAPSILEGHLLILCTVRVKKCWKLQPHEV